MLHLTLTLVIVDVKKTVNAAQPQVQLGNRNLGRSYAIYNPTSSDSQTLYTTDR